MDTRMERFGWLAPLAVSVVVLAAGCGGDAGDDGGGADGSQKTDSSVVSDTARKAAPATGEKGATGDSEKAAVDPTTAGTDEQQVHAVVATVQKAFLDRDGVRMCGHLTAVAQRQLRAMLLLNQRGGSCAEVVHEKSVGAAGVDQNPTEVLSVKFAGDKAVARVSDGGRAPRNMRFVKQDGEWKVADLMGR